MAIYYLYLPFIVIKIVYCDALHNVCSSEWIVTQTAIPIMKGSLVFPIQQID
jgi:hypothetical protein